MKAKQILIIDFHDNDFQSTLKQLGTYLIDYVGVEALHSMKSRGELHENLSNMFRALLTLHQHRFDLYKRWGKKGEIIDRNLEYMCRDYFNLKHIKFKYKLSPRDLLDNNGERLIVDFENKTCRVI